MGRNLRDPLKILPTTGGLVIKLHVLITTHATFSSFSRTGKFIWLLKITVFQPLQWGCELYILLAPLTRQSHKPLALKLRITLSQLRIHFLTIWADWLVGYFEYICNDFIQSYSWEPENILARSYNKNILAFLIWQWRENRRLFHYLIQVIRIYDTCL